MPSHNRSDHVKSGQIGVTMLPALMEISLASPGESDFLSEAMARINEETGAKFTAIVRGIKGQWRTLASAGSKPTLPTELLAEALDSEKIETSPDWIAAPLLCPSQQGCLLVQKTPDPLVEAEFNSLAAALAMTLEAWQTRSRLERRTKRLEAVLEMTANWNQSRQTDELLEQIAQASTRLLGAERATIFLPDPSHSFLIGKPALGVEGGTLQIPVNAGVVGQVMQSGQPARVDRDIRAEQQQINREVDQQLGFQTDTLLCVPLINSSGKTIGAFELINRIDGNFTDEDEAALTELAAHATVALDTTKHVEQLESSRRHVSEQAAEQVQLIGDCEEIQKLKATIERIANTDLVVLITGENGTGKEVVAQLIHYLSDRRDNVLVAVNCAAISETLLESELFGHEKGAFTDAHQAREGKFELANGGTLFLDEIGDMSLGGQSKLLRVLEERTVVRVGGSVPIPTTARMIAATNQNLSELVNKKRFRQDLYFRLNVVPIELPPLRERGDDIILLARHFLDEFCARARRQTPEISAAARKRLLAHRWPGNVRELRNMMERLAYLSDGDKIDVEDLAFVNSPKSQESVVPMDLPLNEATRQFQCDYIQRHIKRANGNMTDAAARMGLHRSNLYRKMKQLGMSESDAGETGDEPVDESL
jgi:transcriptional regulator with GAF, ATPase, and Fis domain